MYSLFRLQWLPGQGPLSTTHSGFSLQCLFTISQTYCLFFVSRCVIIGEVEILGSWRTGNLTSGQSVSLDTSFIEYLTPVLQSSLFQ